MSLINCADTIDGYVGKEPWDIKNNNYEGAYLSNFTYYFFDNSQEFFDAFWFVWHDNKTSYSDAFSHFEVKLNDNIYYEESIDKNYYLIDFKIHLKDMYERKKNELSYFEVNKMNAWVLDYGKNEFGQQIVPTCMQNLDYLAQFLEAELNNLEVDNSIVNKESETYKNLCYLLNITNDNIDSIQLYKSANELKVNLLSHANFNKNKDENGIPCESESVEIERTGWSYRYEQNENNNNTLVIFKAPK